MKGGNVDDTSFVYGTPVSRLGRHSERRDPERLAKNQAVPDRKYDEPLSRDGSN